jgi:hypothetical protein
MQMSEQISALAISSSLAAVVRAVQVQGLQQVVVAGVVDSLRR